jgi:hypothetical protein
MRVSRSFTTVTCVPEEWPQIESKGDMKIFSAVFKDWNTP